MSEGERAFALIDRERESQSGHWNCPGLITGGVVGRGQGVCISNAEEELVLQVRELGKYVFLHTGIQIKCTHPHSHSHYSLYLGPPKAPR